jgi:hypothetical protein
MGVKTPIRIAGVERRQSSMSDVVIDAVEYNRDIIWRTFQELYKYVFIVKEQAGNLARPIKDRGSNKYILDQIDRNIRYRATFIDQLLDHACCLSGI